MRVDSWGWSLIVNHLVRYLAGTTAGEVTLHSFRDANAKRSFSVPLPAQLEDQQMGVASLQFSNDGCVLIGVPWVNFLVYSFSLLSLCFCFCCVFLAFVFFYFYFLLLFYFLFVFLFLFLFLFFLFFVLSFLFFFAVDGVPLWRSDVRV